MYHLYSIAGRVTYNENVLNKDDDVRGPVSIQSKNGNHLQSTTMRHVANIKDLDSYYTH
jgi:hypothetical protein